MQSGFGNRLRARLVAVQVLYQDDLNRDVNPAQADDFVRRRLRDPQLIEFARSLIAGVRRNRAELDALLSETAENWSLDRMAATDRNVLRVGAFELVHTDTPGPVCVNEAVELAKRLGRAQSGPFVNGVLDRLLASRPTQQGKATKPVATEESTAVALEPDSSGIDIKINARQAVSPKPPAPLGKALRNRTPLLRRSNSQIHFPPERLALCRQRLVAYAEEHRTRQSGGRGSWKWEEALDGEGGLLQALEVEPLFKDVVHRRAVALNLRERQPAAGNTEEPFRDFWESDEGWRAFIEVISLAIEDRRADRAVQRVRAVALADQQQETR